MNKKLKKILIIGLANVSLSGNLVSIIPNTAVYADEMTQLHSDYTVLVNSYNYVYISRLSSEEQQLYKKAIVENVSHLSSEESIYKVIELIDRYVAYDKGYVVYDDRDGSFWDGQGITVGELGAVINGIVSAAIGGGTLYGAAQWAIKKELKTKITGYLAAIGAAVFTKQVSDFIDSVSNFVDLGGHIARFIDSIDFYKNNGRINLWP